MTQQSLSLAEQQLPLTYLKLATLFKFKKTLAVDLQTLPLALSTSLLLELLLLTQMLKERLAELFIGMSQ
jgi:hypothetical protein